MLNQQQSKLIAEAKRILESNDQHRNEPCTNLLEWPINLWVDDLRPIRPGYNFVVKTAKEAIEVLKTGKVSSISLDHDLGPPSAGTGYDIAQWIEQAAFHGTIKKISWSIHSANPVGVANMKSAMQSADNFWNNK